VVIKLNDVCFRVRRGALRSPWGETSYVYIYVQRIEEEVGDVLANAIKWRLWTGQFRYYKW